MTGSPSSIISLGFGSWGSVGLVLTLGYGTVGAGATGPGRLEYTLPKCIPEFTVQMGLLEYTLPKSAEFEVGEP